MAVAAMRESSMCDDVDRALVEALRLRKPAAAERLVAAYRSTAHRWAQRVTGQAADAEEVAQDALWTVILKIDTFQGNAAFRSWLYRIVANAAYQKVRDRRAQPGTTSLDEAVVFVRERSDPARRTELRTALTAAIDELPAGHRTTLLLREVEGRSNGEISRALGLPVPNVKTRVHRARTFLRRRLAVYRGLMSSER
jgi:RNA polymerase sigma-70 factor, ECF subfamily